VRKSSLFAAALVAATGNEHGWTLSRQRRRSRKDVVRAAPYAQLDGRRLVLANGRTIVVKML
jgi:hypothetical protein